MMIRATLTAILGVAEQRAMTHQTGKPTFGWVWGLHVEHLEQKAIELFRGELLTNEARLYEHLSRTFQWLMATLFAANGGGIIALLSEGAHDLPGRTYALGWLSVGIILSLLMGVLSAFVSVRATTAMAKMRLRMEECLITEQTCEQELIDFVNRMQPNWKTWFPSYAGAASFGLFIIGLATIAGSLIRSAYGF